MVRIGRLLGAVLGRIPAHSLPCIACGAPPRTGLVLVIVVAEDPPEPARCHACGHSVDGEGRTLIGRPLVVRSDA